VGTSALPLALIHRSAWKRNSEKLDFRFTEFSEVDSQSGVFGSKVSSFALPCFELRGRMEAVPKREGSSRCSIPRWAPSWWW
jgi:hypothetical protein